VKLIPIQILRAAAALSIAVLHGQHEAGLLQPSGGDASRLLAFFPWAAGVDVFFVISGFVMVYASRTLFARNGAVGIFLARRVARIVPLYWLTTTAYLVLALAAPTLLNGALLSPGFVALSYLFIPVARPDGLVQPLYSLGWTLNYEMMFYLVFAAAIALPRRAAVSAVAGALVGLVVIGRLAPLPQPFGFWTEPILLEFGVGVVLGLLRTEGVTLGLVPRLALGTAGAALLAAQGGAETAGMARAIGWGLPAACLVAACGLGADDRTRDDTRLARVWAALGDASYALYLLHPFVLRGTRALLQGVGAASTTGPLAFLALGLTIAAVASWLVYRFVEIPLTRALRRGLEPRRSA
jgi:exopolysaccharide production protein ExoZ